MEGKIFLDYLNKRGIVLKVYQRINRKYLYDFSIVFKSPSGKIHTVGSAKLNKKDALEGALGEFMEIYSALNYGFQEVFKKNVENIEFPLKEYIKLRKEDFKERNYKELKKNSLIYGKRGKDLFSNKDLFLPSFAIHLSHLDKEKFYPVMSHGLGSQKSISGAIKHGLNEIIEADAAITWWRKGGNTKYLEINNINSKTVFSLKKKIEAENLSMDVFFVTQDIPLPVFVCLLYSDKKPYISVGIGSSFNVEKAIVKSIEESLIIRNSLENYLKKNKNIKIRKKDIHSYFDHALYYGTNKIDYRQKFSFKKISLKEIISNQRRVRGFEELCDFLNKRRFRVYWTELTPTFIKKSSPYRQVKVICPSLNPINMGLNYFYNSIFNIKKDGLIHPFG